MTIQEIYFEYNTEKFMKASDFDKKFDSGEDNITQFLDLSKTKRAELEIK